jgi:hypothetical protein
MSRVAFLLILLSGVAVTATSVEAKPAKSTHKKSKAKKKDNRTPTRSTKSNMPRGFTWPANKHMVAMGEECTRSVEALGVSFEPAKAAGRVVTPMLPSAEINGVTFTPV